MSKKNEQKEYVLAIAAIVAIVLIVVLVQKVPFQKNLAGQGFLSASSFTVPVDLGKLMPMDIEFGQWYKMQVSDDKLLVEKVTAKKELAQINEQTKIITPLQTQTLLPTSLKSNVVYLVKSDGQSLRVYEWVSVSTSDNELTGQVGRRSYRKLAADSCSCCWAARYGNQYCDCTPAGCGGTCSSQC